MLSKLRYSLANTLTRGDLDHFAERNQFLEILHRDRVEEARNDGLGFGQKAETTKVTDNKDGTSTLESVLSVPMLANMSSVFIDAFKTVDATNYLAMTFSSHDYEGEKYEIVINKIGMESLAEKLKHLERQNETLRRENKSLKACQNALS